MSGTIMEQPTAGVLIIGDEILRGQVVDTNTSYLATSLKSAGVKLRKVVVVPDVIDEIAEEVLEASKRYSVVFTSGGVGPTHDDVTYVGVAKGLGLKLEEHEELVEIFTRLFPEQLESRRLATVPSPCELVYIPTAGSAETYPIVKVANTYILPGSPKYFRQAVDTIVPRLRGATPLSNEFVDVAFDELSIVGILDELVERWTGRVNIGSYPQRGTRIFTRITLEGTLEAVNKAKEEFLNSLPSRNVTLSHRFNMEHAQAVVASSECQEHVKNAINILQRCYNEYNANEIFVSFNGGKDCTAVLHLTATVVKLRKVSPLICLYITGDSFPEVDAFVEYATNYYGLEMIRKTRPIKTALESLLNEQTNVKASIMGTRKGDPGSENLEPFTFTDSEWPAMMRVCPILDWSYKQIWQFLLEHEIPYCPLYDRGYTSLGSRATTKPNPLLKDPNNSSSYLPAHTLADDSAEREDDPEKGVVRPPSSPHVALSSRILQSEF